MVEVAALPVVCDAAAVGEADLAEGDLELESEAEADAEAEPDEAELVMAAVDRVESDLELADLELAEAEEADAVEEAAADAEEAVPPLRAIGPP